MSEVSQTPNDLAEALNGFTDLYLLTRHGLRKGAANRSNAMRVIKIVIPGL